MLHGVLQVKLIGPLHHSQHTHSVLLLLSFTGTLRTEPFPLGLACETNTGEVEPLNWTIGVVAANHLAIGDLVTEAVGGFIGVHRHV